MSNPYSSAVDFAAGAVVKFFLLPVGGVMILGTIAFGLLQLSKPQRKRRKR